MTWTDIARNPDLARLTLMPAFPEMRESHLKAAAGDRIRFVTRMAGLHDLTETEAAEALEDRLGMVRPAALLHAAE
ncbi:hypothetical protein AADZ90_009750 [Aestuariibius sp. 2305UL40-4]|uniref:hypothetical protein n=1 Tax=Aestuariibius violaceus TaxID=3234132 RepID=UPI00345F030C